MTSGKVTVPYQFMVQGKNPPLSTLSTLSRSAGQSFTNTFRYLLTYGTGTSQINTIIANPYTLAASGTANHNFFDGTVPDIFGDANGLQNIKYLAVYLVANTDNTTAATSVTIGNGATPLTMNIGGTATHVQASGGPAMVWGRPAGYSVTALLQLLKIVNNDATNKATYWIEAGGVKV